MILICKFTSMKKKIALNVFYNLGVILSICGIFWAIKNANYLGVAIFVATTGFFMYLKIQLIKDLRDTLKGRKKDL